MRVEIFDLLIFPINLNLDNRGYSFKIIFNETLSFETLSKVISISEKRFCCHNLLMAELILLPGTLIIWLFFNPDMSIIFDLFTYLVPMILTFERMYSFGWV